VSALTQRQSEVVRFIENFSAGSGYPPTRAEIARHFGWSSANAAEDHLRALVKKGVIALVPGISRGIRVVG
jgi:repressor LexA